MKKNPLYFLRKYLPEVARNKKIIVVSVLNTLYPFIRTMYYMCYTNLVQNEEVRQGISLTRVNVRYTDLKKLCDVSPGLNVTPYYKTSIKNKKNINKILKAFDYKDPEHPHYEPGIFTIDTICITSPDGTNHKIVYDLVGHTDVARQFKEKSLYWIGQRKLAEENFNPDLLKELGYFENIHYPDEETERVLKLKKSLRDEPVYPSIFGFGRNKLISEIRYLRVLIK